MEMLSTPLCSVFARVTVEYREITLTPYAGKIDDEGIGILHRPSLTFVVMYADLVGGIVAEMLVEGLETKNVLLAYKWLCGVQRSRRVLETYRSPSTSRRPADALRRALQRPFDLREKLPNKEKSLHRACQCRRQL